MPIALLQVQATPYAGEDSFHQAGDIAERPGFRLRRARFGLGGDLLRQIDFALSGQIGSEDEGTLLVHDAWAGYTGLPYLQVFAGAKDVPFSRSALTGAGDGALIERPFAVRAIAPFKQVGIQLGGKVARGAFQYQAGMFNGFQRSDQFSRASPPPAASRPSRSGRSGARRRISGARGSASARARTISSAMAAPARCRARAATF
jgi:hypothetical protein